MTTLTDFDDHIVVDRSINGGSQAIYRFPNNYGASLIRNGAYAYGGMEIGVIQFTEPNDSNWTLTYDTPVTDDVLGYLTDETSAEALQAISDLPAFAEAKS